MNVKSVRFLFQFFVQLPNLILVCGIVERESLKDIIPVEYWFCGSVGEGRSNNTSSQRPCTSRAFSRIYSLGISKGLFMQRARLTVSSVPDSNSFKNLPDLSFFICSCLTVLRIRPEPARS